MSHEDSEKEELALDEEAGVLGNDVEKMSRDSGSPQQARDPYIDADGLEKAER